MKISKYISVDFFSNKLYIDVLRTPFFLFANRSMTDDEITVDFYNDINSAFLKLKPNVKYKMSTHSVIIRMMRKNIKSFDIISYSSRSSKSLYFINLLIGKKQRYSKLHTFFDVEFTLKSPHGE